MTAFRELVGKHICKATLVMICEHHECHITGAHNIIDSTAIMVQGCAQDLTGLRQSSLVGYFANIVMTFLIPCKGGIFLTIYMIFSFLVILLHNQILND
jgi:hypothetical protein